VTWAGSVGGCLFGVVTLLTMVVMQLVYSSAVKVLQASKVQAKQSASKAKCKQSKVNVISSSVASCSNSRRLEGVRALV